MNEEKTGRIVWHDLFTDDARISRAFYERVAGWNYVSEHASDFAWGGGEQDFILALFEEEAGAGFATKHDGQAPGWIAYVEVPDVDASAERARDLGGTVEREPFEVPGVGRNCLLRDPLGARIGICLSRHNFPRPTKQFALERYCIAAGNFPEDFYRALFDWHIAVAGGPIAETGAQKPEQTQWILLGEDPVAIRTGANIDFGEPSIWLPGLKVARLAAALEEVQMLEGSVLSPDQNRAIGESYALVGDPNGTAFFLVA